MRIKVPKPRRTFLEPDELAALIDAACEQDIDLKRLDVKWVMNQVGHADSKMTMNVYAQLQQRANRGRGAKFDKLVRDARDELLTRH